MLLVLISAFKLLFHVPGTVFIEFFFRDFKYFVVVINIPLI